MTIYYPDVSQFTPGASLADTVAVCARASEGDWLYDSTYAWYKNEAATQKCPFFAYHVIEAGNAAAQARWCHNRVGSIPLMMDIEKAGSSTPKIGDVTGFIDAYRALGGLTWLAYLPKWYWQSIGSPSLAPVAQRGCHLVSSDYTTYSDSGPGWARRYPGDPGSPSHPPSEPPPWRSRPEGCPGSPRPRWPSRTPADPRAAAGPAGTATPT
jgi:hypothetical protein